MQVAHNWDDYELIDSGDGERLERWGGFLLRRPDPQALWPQGDHMQWNVPDAWYKRSTSGGGTWKLRRSMPKSWAVRRGKAVLRVELMGFKHTGVFPEQAVNWDWIQRKITSASRPIRVLNLFAYTGGATVAAALAGAEVCHVDASRGMIDRAKENLTLSGIPNAPVRFLVDDVVKFVEREYRRGRKYDAIILDPPSFGRGPRGEVWKVAEGLPLLLEGVGNILSERPLFVLVNSYTSGLSPVAIQNQMYLSIGCRFGGVCSSSEIGIPMSFRKEMVLPCGVFARWESSEDERSS